MASELRRRRASYERRDHCEFGLLCIRVWFSFALFWVFFFFFFFFDKHLCIEVCFAFALYRLYWGLVFSAKEVTVDLISNSLYWFFFFFWRIRGFATSIICWAHCGLGSITIFFFWLESRTDNFFFNLMVFLIL